MSANAAVSSADYALTVKNAVAADPAKVVEIVTQSLKDNPELAAEIVAAAIEGAKADAKTVALIVQSAIAALPGQASLIASSAFAAAPDAKAEVSAALATLGVSIPSTSGGNLLDFPAGPESSGGASNVVGPAPGMAPGTAGAGGAGSIVVNTSGGSGGAGASSAGGGSSNVGNGGTGSIPDVVVPDVSTNQP